MRATYDIKLPQSRFPKFPNRCVVCGREDPPSAVRLSTHAFEWWMALAWPLYALARIKGFQYAVPACTRCTRAFMRQYRIRLFVELILIAAAIIISLYVVRGIPRPWQKWAGIAAAVLIAVPLLSWKVIWPMAVQIDASGSTIEYQFTDSQYAQDFAAMNLPMLVKAQEPPPGGTAEQSQENAHVRALFNEGRLDAMISIVENRLKRIRPATPFHAIIGKDYLHQVEAAADWLAQFHDECAKVFRPAAIYVEMNRFDINFDRWYVEAFGHEETPNKSMEQAEWDGDVSPEFVLTGMEDIQKAMEDFWEAQKAPESFDALPQHLRDAQGDAFFLVMLHMQNLLKRAWRQCGQRGHPVGSVPVSANVHDETMVFTVKPDEMAALAAAGGRSVPPPKYVNLPEYQLKYPHNWRVDVDDMYHDIRDRLTIVGPGGGFIRLELYDEAAMNSPDELTRENARILWDREGVSPPTDVSARARKLVKDEGIVKPVAKRFDHWGQYRGEGVRLTGQIKSTPVSAALFAGRIGSRSFVIGEQCMDQDLPRCSAGFELVRSTFRLGITPSAPGTC